SEWRGDDRQGDPWLAGPPWYENALQTDPGATHWAAASYDCKTPITAADLLNDRVVPFFDAHDVKLLRVLTDCGSECVPSSCSLVLRSLRACPPQGEFIGSSAYCSPSNPAIWKSSPDRLRARASP